MKPRRYCYNSWTATNNGRITSFLESESSSNEELVEYFRIPKYSKTNNSSFKEPSNWTPFKEMFYDDNFLLVVGLRLAEDTCIAQIFPSKHTVHDLVFTNFFLWFLFSCSHRQVRAEMILTGDKVCLGSRILSRRNSIRPTLRRDRILWLV